MVDITRHKLGRWLWVPVAGKFQKGWILYLGKIPAGRIIIKESRITDGVWTYWPELSLPSHKPRKPVYCMGLDSAKQAVEEMLTEWCAEAEAEYVPE